MASLSSELLPDVRNYLDVTWDDPDGDRKLAGIIGRGTAYLDGVAGAKLDYTVEGSARALLFDYCRYARDNALHEFEVNYQAMLLALQIATETSPGAAAPPPSAEGGK